MSVVVPFLGDAEEAAELEEALGCMGLRDGDEVLIVDNGCEPPLGDPAATRARVVRAAGRLSSYHARNAGAAAARNDWVLFLDADCRPPENLLDEYLAEAPDERCGIVAGEVSAASDQRSLAARHAASRDHLGVETHHLSKGPHPAGVTASLMVRRAAWEDAGGFHELRSGADLEFCWRVQDLGWGFDFRPRAVVEHRHAERLGQMLRKARRYGPGQLWVNRRYPGAASRPPLIRQVLRGAAGLVVWSLVARFERAAFKAIDALWMCAYSWGYFAGDNRPRRGPHSEDAAARSETLVCVAGGFPDRDRPEVLACLRQMREAGQQAAVVSPVRPRRVDPDGLAEFDASYLEDDAPLERARSLAWAVGRHPLRSLRDRVARSGAPSGRLPLTVLAPAVRRLARRPDVRLCAEVTPGTIDEARRLARLAGLGPDVVEPLAERAGTAGSPG